MIGIGIVGLPNVGKSTLFNALTKSTKALAANYPFATIEPNVGLVEVPDKRLQKLVEIVNPKRVVGSTVEFIDIAGLVKGASNNEGLGNQFLSNIRNVAAICHVVRCFEDENIVHVEGSISPLRDIEIINTELIFSDLEVINRAITKNTKLAKSNKDAKFLVDTLEKCKNHLQEFNMLKTLDLSKDEKDIISQYQFLTIKPIMFALNISEQDLTNQVENEHVKAVKEYAKTIDAETVIFSARVEAELIEIEDESERQMFIESLNITEPSLDRLIRKGFKLLDLISYFTAGVQEVRSWTITKGTLAPKAASEIHSDIEKGFIRAEVVSFDEFYKNGGWNGSKEKGVMRLEGKEYIVKDGDVMYFRFNV